MSILPPDKELTPPNLAVLVKGRKLHRIHDSNFGGNEFNPGFGVGRFSPIVSNDETKVPTLYASSSFSASVYETLFRNIPIQSKNKFIHRSSISEVTHSILTLKRDLCVAMLRGADLMKWRISRNELITCSSKLYSQTASWSNAIYRQFKSVDGIIWTSNQCDPHDCFMFYGARVNAEDFEINFWRRGKDSISLENDVKALGRRSSVNIWF